MSGETREQTKETVAGKIKGGLIVSCQALQTEPLYGSYIMGRMAYAAMEGGAAGIRANTPQDITEIKKTVNLPVIGLYKAEYEDSEVYITPTMKEVDALAEAGPEIIAVDATNRLRPGGQTLGDFFARVKEKYPKMLFMADCATYEDASYAQGLGFDFAGTTLRGYTKDTAGIAIPDYGLLEKMCSTLEIPVIAEGGIWEREQLQRAFACGIHAAVIGTAITRPREITRRFVNAIQGK